MLRELYAHHSDRELAARLGRSEWAVKGKARALGLARDLQDYPGYRAPRESRPWSAAETELLKEVHGTMPYEEIADRVGRTRNAVHLKAGKLGLRKMEFWNGAEDEFLKEAQKTLLYREVGQLLGRSTSAVSARATTLGLPHKRLRSTEQEAQSLATVGKTEAMAGSVR